MEHDEPSRCTLITHQSQDWRQNIRQNIRLDTAQGPTGLGILELETYCHSERVFDALKVWDSNVQNTRRMFSLASENSESKYSKKFDDIAMARWERLPSAFWVKTFDWPL